MSWRSRIARVGAGYQIQAEQPIDLHEEHGPHAGYYCPMKTTLGRIASVNPPPFRSHHSGEWSASWLEREDIATTMSMADCLGVFVLWSDERSVLESDLEQLTDFRPYELVE